MNSAKLQKKTKTTIIGLTETKFDANVLDGEVNIDGYDPIATDTGEG